MLCPQVVDDSALIFTLFLTPRAVGQPTEVAYCISIMYAHKPHYLWGLGWGYHLEEF